MNQEVESMKTSNENTSRILELVNSALGPDDLVPLVGSEDIAMSLIDARRSVGGFVSLTQLEKQGGLSTALIDKMIAFVAKAKVEFDTEKLNYVMWAHGNSLLADDRSPFNAERTAAGLRIRSKSRAERQESAYYPPGYPPGADWLHISIPTPAFANGEQYYLRDVILNYSNRTGYDKYERPTASLGEIEVRDGHVRLLKTVLRTDGGTNSHRYRRIPVDAGRKIKWGIGVSLLPYLVRWDPPSDEFITVAAVGAEFVTRSGLVARE